MNHLQEDGSGPLKFRRENTLHEALKIMIVEDEKAKLFNASRKGVEASNLSVEHRSFPLDLGQGNILHQALQLMKVEMKK